MVPWFNRDAPPGQYYRIGISPGLRQSTKSIVLNVFNISNILPISINLQLRPKIKEAGIDGVALSGGEL